MVPSDYRLDEVVARLIERLEGARPTFDDRASAAAAFERIALAHVDSAIGEYREMMPDERDRARQEALLREEVLSTFLPRYLRAAVEMNARERGNFGAGRLGEPAGRAVLVVGVMLAMLPLLRVVGNVWMWPILLLILTIPAWPDFVAWGSRRRYFAELQAMIDDMQRIQEQATAYLPPGALDVEARPPVRERPKEGEWRS